MTIGDIMYYCSIEDMLEFRVWDYADGGNVVYEGVAEDCPYLDTEFNTWDVGNDGWVYFNIDTSEEA